jgi:multidrug resistance efflux pump
LLQKSRIERYQKSRERKFFDAPVANMEAQLQQARYYLDNTTLTAPEDGRIINLQVRPGMVSGIYRIVGRVSPPLICRERFFR